MIDIEADDTPPGTQADGQDWPSGHSVLLARRHRYTRKISYFRAWTPTPVPLVDLVAVVCARWHVDVRQPRCTSSTFRLSWGASSLELGPALPGVVAAWAIAEFFQSV